MVKGINQEFTRVSEKFKTLPDYIQMEINYNNLVLSFKNIVNQLGYNGDVVFKRYCLIKNDIDIDNDINVITYVSSFWTFLKLNISILNENAYSFEKLLSKKRSIGDAFKTINFLTRSKFGFYLPLSLDLDNLDETKLCYFLSDLW